jgi:hypothetical protein
MKLQRMDSNSRQNGWAASTALPAVMRNEVNEDLCELSDKITSRHLIILFLHHYYDQCVPICTASLYLPSKCAVGMLRKQWTILSGKIQSHFLDSVVENFILHTFHISKTLAGHWSHMLLSKSFPVEYTACKTGAHPPLSTKTTSKFQLYVPMFSTVKLYKFFLEYPLTVKLLTSKCTTGEER